MKTFTTTQLGIDQGRVDLFSDFAQGGDMWTGNGPRERRRKVQFSKPFLMPPIVHVGLSLVDIGSQANIRCDLIHEDVTETGFTSVVRTWMDTRIARVRVSWIAFGQVENEDDWQLY